MCRYIRAIVRREIREIANHATVRRKWMQFLTCGIESNMKNSIQSVPPPSFPLPVIFAMRCTAQCIRARSGRNSSIAILYPNAKQLREPGLPHIRNSLCVTIHGCNYYSHAEAILSNISCLPDAIVIKKKTYIYPSISLICVHIIGLKCKSKIAILRITFLCNLSLFCKEKKSS